MLQPGLYDGEAAVRVYTEGRKDPVEDVTAAVVSWLETYMYSELALLATNISIEEKIAMKIN